MNESGRVAAILAAPEAVGVELLAQHLALHSQLPVEEARRTLAVAQKSAFGDELPSASPSPQH